MQETHLALAVPPPVIIPKGVLPQSQTFLVGFQVRVLEMHEQVLLLATAAVLDEILAQLKQLGELPLVIIIEVAPQPQVPLLASQFNFPAHLQEVLVALPTVFVPAPPQM